MEDTEFTPRRQQALQALRRGDEYPAATPGRAKGRNLTQEAGPSAIDWLCAWGFAIRYQVKEGGAFINIVEITPNGRAAASRLALEASE